MIDTDFRTIGVFFQNLHWCDIQAWFAMWLIWDFLMLYTAQNEKITTRNYSIAKRSQSEQHSEATKKYFFHLSYLAIMIYPTTIRALFLKDFVVLKTLRLNNFEIWVFWILKVWCHNLSVIFYLFEMNLISGLLNFEIKKLARFFQQKPWRFLPVLITYFLIFKRSL